MNLLRLRNESSTGACAETSQDRSICSKKSCLLFVVERGGERIGQMRMSWIISVRCDWDGDYFVLHDLKFIYNK